MQGHLKIKNLSLFVSFITVAFLVNSCVTLEPETTSDGVYDDLSTTASTLTEAQSQALYVGRISREAAQEVAYEFEGEVPETNHTPSSFNNELVNIFDQAVVEQPALQTGTYYLAEWAQLTSLNSVDKTTSSRVSLLTFAIPVGSVGATDWVVRLVVNIDNWTILDWDVNKNLSGGFRSAMNHFPNVYYGEGVEDFTVYRRRVNNGSGSTYNLTGSKLYVADVRGSTDGTRLYGDDGSVYRINSLGGSYSLTAVGTW